MKTTSSAALAFGVLASKPASVDAFMVAHPALVLQPCSSHGETAMNIQSPLGNNPGAIGGAGSEFSRGAGGDVGQPRRPRGQHGQPQMSVAGWKQRRRRLSATNGSHLQQHLEDFRHVKAITGGVSEFMSVIDESLSGELVTVMTYMPWCRSCKYTRQRLRTLAESHAGAGNGAMFYEMDLSANPQVHEMLDIHAAPTVLLYIAGQLVDEFVCGGENGSKTLVRHIEAQIGPEPERP